MIDPGLISNWKKEYGEIYSVSIAKVDYVFRPLTFREYDNLTELDMADAEEAILDVAILWPKEKDFSKAKAGVISSLAEEIIDCSGFTDIDSAKSILQQKRELAQSFRFNMKAFVLATQPNIDEATLDDMTLSQLATKVAMAERIIAIKQAVLNIPETGVQLEIIDPDEEKTAPVETRELRDMPVGPDYKPSNLGAAVVGDPTAEKLRAALRG